MPGDAVVKLADAGPATQQTIFNVGAPDASLAQKGVLLVASGAPRAG